MGNLIIIVCVCCRAELKRAPTADTVVMDPDAIDVAADTADEDQEEDPFEPADDEEEEDPFEAFTQQPSHLGSSVSEMSCSEEEMDTESR